MKTSLKDILLSLLSIGFASTLVGASVGACAGIFFGGDFFWPFETTMVLLFGAGVLLWKRSKKNSIVSELIEDTFFLAAFSGILALILTLVMTFTRSYDMPFWVYGRSFLLSWGMVFVLFTVRHAWKLAAKRRATAVPPG
ncbi:MAG: hypothetical protein AAB373_01195 [Patescibacteria group bacterium]